MTLNSGFAICCVALETLLNYFSFCSSSGNEHNKDTNLARLLWESDEMPQIWHVVGTHSVTILRIILNRDHSHCLFYQERKIKTFKEVLLVLH